MNVVGSLLLTFALVLSPSESQAEFCGDVDDSGVLVASDALTVLRDAVGLPGELSCPTCIEEPPVLTSTTGDECFDDQDCSDSPDSPFCGGRGGYSCVECDNDDDDCDQSDVCIWWECANRCGDFDASGTVDASDSLRLLRNAVGTATPIACPGCSPVTPTTSTTSSTSPPHVDECFDDSDCVGFPAGRIHCGGPSENQCVECDDDTHCDGNEVCQGYECVEP